MRVNFNTPATPVTAKKTVHNITILDSSGSMNGGKWSAAVEFANKEMTDYQNQDLVNVVFSTIIFSSHNRIVVTQWRATAPTQIDVVKDFHGDMTALNDAIATTLIRVKADNQEEQVLVKIFTDGDENNSRVYSPAAVTKLVKECMSQGYTITFAGTAGDVRTAQRMYGIDASNTFVHENTADSIVDYGVQTRGITMSYFKSVAKGEDVTRGFYKTIENEN